jgi:hypothetical protein
VDIIGPRVIAPHGCGKLPMVTSNSPGHLKGQMGEPRCSLVGVTLSDVEQIPVLAGRRLTAILPEADSSTWSTWGLTKRKTRTQKPRTWISEVWLVIYW